MAASVIVGLGVNAARWDHQALALERNYFARAEIVRTDPPAATRVEASPGGGQASSESAADGADGFAGSYLGVHGATFDEVQEWFQDPRLAQGLFVFVDARDQGLFDAGRIPGALLVDHYRSDQYLPDALDFILPAEKVIVYCHGGDCEDSIFLAQTLIENGIEPDRIHVYEGGFEEWEAAGMPVQTSEPES